MERPRTQYPKTVAGVHVAYQVFGEGALDIVYTPGFVSNVALAGVPERWRLDRVVA